MANPTRPLHWALPSVVIILLSIASSPVADTTIMRGSKAPYPFKINYSSLSEDQKRCVRYALKQWVMYDKAKEAGNVPNSTTQVNRNETATGVMTPGPDHNLDNAATVNPAKKHALSSRCMSEGEYDSMVGVYGPQSPFHASGQPVEDPVTNPDAWFTNDPGQATMTIQNVDQVPNQKKTVAGLMDFKLIPPTATTPEKKEGPANLYLRNDPGKTKHSGHQRTWCYPSDTDGDGWITNKDDKCPENTLDYYQMVKHELGHWFCFWHKGAEFTIPEQYTAPDTVAGIDSAHDEECGCTHCGGEFASVSAPKIYFSSNRPGGFGGKDIWSASWDDVAHAYATPVNLGAGINSAFDEITPEAAAGEAWLYFASNRPGAGGFDLYVAPRVDSTTWSSAAFLGSVNSPADDTSPMEWNDRLLFASKRAGGMGDWDIWMAMKTGTPSYLGAPVNLGPGINTPFADKDPMLADWDGTSARLYFTSNRPGGFGGFDIYRASMTAGMWGAPANLGPGVNGPMNEVAPHIPPVNDRIFYATDRRAAAGRGWELFESINTRPRISCMAGHDVEGLPGDTLAIPFMVVNDGATPVMVTPTATNADGWMLQYAGGPMAVMPGDVATWIVNVVVPNSAAVGDTTQVDGTVTTGSASSNCGALVIVTPPVTGVERTPVPRVTLSQNIPNPFNPSTVITFTLPRAQTITLEVFDVGGRRVATIASGPYQPGSHDIHWDGRDARGTDVASGVYFYRLRVGGEAITKKMILLK